MAGNCPDMVRNTMQAVVNNFSVQAPRSAHQAGRGPMWHLRRGPRILRQVSRVRRGSKIRVTTKKDDRTVATIIESLDKHAEFAKCSS